MAKRNAKSNKKENTLEDRFKRETIKREDRKLRARKRKDKSIWFGFGMFGLIGWSVSIPTLIGIALGVWIDRQYPGRVSWTLTFLFVGIILGCFNAWYWMNKERREIEDQERK